MPGNAALRNNRLTGGLTEHLRYWYRHQGVQESEKLLTESLSEDYPQVKLHDYEFNNLDDLAPVIHYSYSFEAPNVVALAGEFKMMKTPWQYVLWPEDALTLA